MWLLATALLASIQLAVSEKFFDPTKADFKKCGLDRPGLICDPDSVLSKADRLKLDNELKVLEPRTALRKRGEKKGNCSQAGITPAIYLVRNGEEDTIEAITTFMKDHWTVDKQCNNELMIILSANETQYHVYRTPNATHATALQPYDVAHYINREVDNLINGKFAAALSNILKRTLKRVTDKYTSWQRTTFPNPMRGEHAKCGLKAAGPFCDPDGIFDDEEKAVIVNNLGMFEEQTRNTPVALAYNSTAFCRERGYTMGLAVMRTVEGANQENLTKMAHYMVNTWRLDEKCGKQFIVAVSVDDGFYTVVAPNNSLVRMEKFTQYFSDNGAMFVKSEVRMALKGIFESAAEDAHSGALFSLFNRRKRSITRRL